MNFLPLPQGQGSLRPGCSPLTMVSWNDTLARVALALQTTALELTAGLEDDNAPLPVDEQRLLESYRALPAPLQEIAHRLSVWHHAQRMPAL